MARFSCWTFWWCFDRVETTTLLRVKFRFDTALSVIGFTMDMNKSHSSYEEDGLNEWKLNSLTEMADLRLRGDTLHISPQGSNSVLCGDRLSQMTKTYNDIDAVSRLLEEKERDLELAARIGQSLLEQNKDLRQKNETLEQEFTIANDTVEHLTFEVLAATERVTQLRHELSLKTGLLQIYSQDLDTDSEAGTPVKEKSFIANWETLQKKIQNLEDENVELRTEASHRMDDIEEVEKKELQLIGDCVRELADANMQLNHFKEELAKKNEDSVRQQEEITQLLSQVVDLQRKNRMLVAENSDLQNKLLIVRECQNELSQELIEIKEKYGELLAAFQELQDETRKSARRNTLPRNSGMWPYGTSNPFLNPDSLASELESSMGRESDGYGSDERTSQSKRIFETVKCANGSRFVRQKRSQASGSSSALSPTYTSCFNPGTSSKFSSFGQLSSISSHLASDTESAYADSYHTDDESIYSSFGSGSVQPPQPTSNLAQELEAALKGTSSGSGTLSRRDIFSGRCGSPDSSISGRSSSLGGPLTFHAQQGASSRNFHLPEKLQIVKPLEGSQTLHHWQRLATPHLGALFEVRQGVQVKGGDKPEKVPEPEAYSLSDYEEEDDEEYMHPGKSFMDTGSIYTFTNSTIMHPSEHTLVTPSYPVLQLSTRIVSEPPSNLQSPQSMSSRLKDQATSTFSTTQGLAKLLNERGIHGMVPTVMNSKTDKMVSPPPTPAPSPENSPPPSPPPYSPVRVPDLLVGGGEGPTSSSHIAKGAHLLRTKSQRRRKAASSTGDESENTVSRESKSQQTILSINLLEKLSRIGLENIVAMTAASVYHRSTALGRSSRTKVNLKTIDDDAPLTMNSDKVTLIGTVPTVTSGGSDRPIPTVLPMICATEGSSVTMKPDSLTDSGISDGSSKEGSSPNRQWGYVPAVMKSPASLGLTPGVAPPLSYMPNPMLQLNCLRPSGRSQDVGTLGTLKILRKGGYS